MTGIETFNKTLDYGEAGDNVGILVRGLTREQIRRGLVIAKPGSLTTASCIAANIYCLSADEGGRKNSFTSGYKPQVLFDYILAILQDGRHCYRNLATREH